jgi:energy-coupling factor transport system substrate-specific component
MNSPSRSISARELAVTALLAAILLAAQVALSFLPNIELVSLLLILYAICFPLRQALMACWVFVLLEGLLYGFGSWWVMYLYIWPLLVLLARQLQRHPSSISAALLSGGFGLSFGALCAIPYALTGGFAYGISWWISGIPFDIAHCLGNAAAALVLFRPLLKVFSRLSGYRPPEK